MHEELILKLAALPEIELLQLVRVQKGTDPDLEYLHHGWNERLADDALTMHSTQSSAQGG